MNGKLELQRREFVLESLAIVCITVQAFGGIDGHRPSFRKDDGTNLDDEIWPENTNIIKQRTQKRR